MPEAQLNDAQIRAEVLGYYSPEKPPRCACPGCGETRNLELDHKGAGGNAHRRELKRQGSSFYREVKTKIDAGDLPWLRTLELLCKRCNVSKSDGPHCTLNHRLAPQTPTGAEIDATLQAIDEARLLEKNETLAPIARITIGPRVLPSSREWLNNQELAHGEVIDRLIEEKKQAEPTIIGLLHDVLRELHALRQAVKDVISAQTEPAKNLGSAQAVPRMDAGVFDIPERESATPVSVPPLPEKRWRFSKIFKGPRP